MARLGTRDSTILSTILLRKDGSMYEWVSEFPGAITVCDREGIILEMNERAAASFAADGGRALIGCNVLDCHPEPARTKLRQLLEAGQNNIYTIEKKGVRKLIFQAPWRQGGEYRGFVELDLELPSDMPHFIRG